MKRALRRSRGFTLVELMVSLVAGVLVSLAVIGLARSATNSFHEQARVAGTEAALRNAAERLRSDLTRAGFLSTPNIQLDPRVAVQGPGAPQPGKPLLAPGTTIQDLQSIRIGVGVSKALTQGPNNLANLNNLNPDDIIISGDFTTDAQYAGRLTMNGTTTGGMRIELDPAKTQDANLPQLLGIAGTENTNVGKAFRPGAVNNYVRVVDSLMKYHFAVAGAAGYGACSPGPCAFIDLVPAGPACPPAGATGLLCSSVSNGFANEGQIATIAPVQRVRYFLSKNTDPRIDADPALGEPTGPTSQKFNLYRQTLDTTGAPIPGPAEIIAEYAVDLKFGITVQDPSNNNALTIVDVDNDVGPPLKGPPVAGPAANAVGVTHDASTVDITNGARFAPGPQNVKSVRFRLALRTPIADRRYTLASPGGSKYIYRYCVNAGCTNFARVRSITTEVAMTNQDTPIFCAPNGPAANCQ